MTVTDGAQQLAHTSAFDNLMSSAPDHSAFSPSDSSSNTKDGSSKGPVYAWWEWSD